MTEVKNKEKGYTFSALGTFYYCQDDYEKAFEALDRGLECFRTPESPNSAGGEHQNDEIILDMHSDRGIYLWKLGKRDEALDSLNKARQLPGSARTYVLDYIAIIIDEMDTTSDGHQLMAALKSWSDKERFSWFEWNLGYWADGQAFSRMYRAAKTTGETKLVLEWLNAFENTLSPTSRSRLGLGVVTAAFYDRVLDDKEKAKETLRQTLAIQPKHDEDDESDTFNEMISQLRAKLASIIFTQFRETSDPQRKDDLFKEMMSLPGMKTDDEFKESHIGMLVVNM